MTGYRHTFLHSLLWALLFTCISSLYYVLIALQPAAMLALLVPLWAVLFCVVANAYLRPERVASASWLRRSLYLALLMWLVAVCTVAPMHLARWLTAILHRGP